MQHLLLQYQCLCLFSFVSVHYSLNYLLVPVVNNKNTSVCTENNREKNCTTFLLRTTRLNVKLEVTEYSSGKQQHWLVAIITTIRQMNNKHAKVSKHENINNVL